MPRIHRAAALSVSALLGIATLPATLPASLPALLGTISSSALAQEAWNPFQEKSAPARPKRQAEPPAAPLPPVLPPMDGAKSWRPDQASAGQTAPAKGPPPDQSTFGRQQLPIFAVSSPALTVSGKPEPRVTTDAIFQPPITLPSTPSLR